MAETGCKRLVVKDKYVNSSCIVWVFGRVLVVISSIPCHIAQLYVQNACLKAPCVSHGHLISVP